MAKKFGYNITHKRNRQIFGYGIPKAAIITIIGLILVGILYLFFSGGEDNEWEESPNIEENEEESDVETADRTQKVETTTPLTEDQQKNCPTLTIPIIDFTEKDLLGDTSQNEKLPPACANEVGASERRLAKLYSNVIKKEQIVNETEQKLGKAIEELDQTLNEIYQEKEYLDQVRACEVPPQTVDVAIPEGEQQEVS